MMDFNYFGISEWPFDFLLVFLIIHYSVKHYGPMKTREPNYIINSHSEFMVTIFVLSSIPGHNHL
jgi:hypothetical protein